MGGRGVPQQFSLDAGRSLDRLQSRALTPTTGGTALIPPFATGGDGFLLRRRSRACYSGVERYSANMLSHIDLDDHMKLSGSLLYGRTRGDDMAGSQGFSQTILNSAGLRLRPDPVFTTARTRS